jgi:hypothetical protein
MTAPKLLEIRAERVRDETSRLDVRVTFENRGDTDLVLNLRNGIGEAPAGTALPTEPLPGQPYEFVCRLTNADGESAPFALDIKRLPLKPAHFQTLRTGESQDVTLSLSRYFELAPSATYTLSCCYGNAESGARFGVRAWTGLICAEALRGVKVARSD